MLGDLSSLISQLHSQDSLVRASAAESICHLGADALPATIALLEACRDKEDQVREWAVAALEDLGPPATASIPQLTLMIGDKDPLVEYWAITLLGRCGENARNAVPDLVARIDSEKDLSVRQRALWAICKIRPSLSVVQDVLEKVAAHDDPRLSALARRVIMSLK
ncbi:MAG: HEAT repeat domain-containing protein [Pirellulales bacterium]